MRKSIAKAALITVWTAIAMPLQAQFTVTKVTGARKAEAAPVEVSRLDNKSEFDNFGPAEYAALYDYNHNTTTKAGDAVTETYITALRIGAEGAIFTDYLTYKSDSLAAAGATPEVFSSNLNDIKTVEHFFVPVITQNIPEGQMVVNDQAGITLATYEEPFAAIDWQLTGNTDTFAGYAVSEATGEYGGRKWSVWFTEEIPVAFGPWKLTGLPGLVLRAADSEGQHEFKLIQFVKSNVPMARVKDVNRVKTERDRFIEQRNKSAQNPLGSINPESITNMGVTKTKGGGARINVNGIDVKVSENKVLPLELK